MRARMRLEQDGVTGMDMSDMSYVTSGYAPLTGRLVQAILLQNGVSAEIQRLLPVSVKEYRQERTGALRENGMRKKTALVVLVGGLSYMEMDSFFRKWNHHRLTFSMCSTMGIPPLSSRMSSVTRS